MARIQTYGLDTVDIGDKLLGSDGAGATKNFSVQEIANFFKNSGSSGASGQFNYQYIRNSGAISKGHMHINAGSDTINFSSVTTLKISKYSQTDGINSLQNYITTEFVGKEIIIADTLIPNNYGVYNVTSVTVDAGNNNFYDLVLSYKSGNGTLTDGQFYSIILFAGAQDLSFEFAQASAATTWTVNHNLGKFPSVTIKLSDGTVGQAAITHTNKNTLTISFSADTSGIAYMN
tara:strand:- start:1168 stop:1866 length:699 start_codon:yes stop_codon:yes gene_type:complete